MSLLSQIPMATWSISDLLKNTQSAVQTWGGLLITLLGCVLIIVGVVKIVMGLISHGKKPTNWAVIIIMIIVGGALAFGGWSLASSVAQGAGDTINDLGNNNIN